MQTQTTARLNRLSYQQLLDRARTEARQAKAADDQANRDYFNHSEYGRLHLIKDLDAFNQHKKDLFVQTVYTGAELRKCLVRLERLERCVAEGRDRLTDLGAERAGLVFACARGAA
ncbi:MAG: hypothetical protein J0I20_00685 [Chloroflexi bacterium]|nr:hypothetical protein [Chloroflexota bacterium]OJV93995.1 MAG: hypothetical protein BGO39_18340 [Chloroflexi bacterium 54-19]